MFNWVCPRCGKDVQPSKTECPYCAERDREAAAAGYPPVGQPGPPPPPPPVQPQAPAYMPAQPQVPPAQPQVPHGWQQPVPPPYAAPQAPAYPPAQAPHYAPPPPGAWPPHHHRSGPPTWVMGLAFALAFIGIGAAVYFGIQRFSRTNPTEKAGLENPDNPSREKVSNPLQKAIEVVGIRMIAENKKPVAKFVVVNHQNAEIDGLTANVTLWASTSRSEEDSVGSFSFKLGSLGPNDSKEMTAPLKTKLKMYELPDWQNATAEIQITAP